jgi:HPt (histidine-containing phosphotransfer) domain-containing protein
MMRSELDPSTDALMAAVRAQFAASLPAKAADITAQLSRCAWSDARGAAHRLRGSAGTYGFAAVGAAAGAIEELLLGEAADPDADTRGRLEAGARDLEEQAARAAAEAR